MITQAELKENIHYDPLTGVFTWIKARGFIAKGSPASGEKITFKNKRYSKPHLAWLYMTGVYPDTPVYTTDNSLKFSDLTLKQAGTVNKDHHDIGINVTDDSFGVFVIEKGKTTDLGLHTTIDAAFIAVMAHLQN